MKSFLLLQSRPEDEASDNEYDAFLEFSGLIPQQLERRRVENGDLPTFNLDEYSGIIIGGGPYNVSYADSKKSEEQLKLEAGLAKILDQVVARDFPFLGACYGVGLLTAHGGGVMSGKFSEPVGPVSISLTNEGLGDPLLANLPQQFEAFAGHKEACEILPSTATLLASSPSCPVQLFRLKSNIYATQFHPELDSRGLEVRINIYKHAGYFPPEATEELIAAGHAANVSQPPKILRNFIARYQR